MQSLDDALEKAEYYLTHETERLEIAGNGQRNKHHGVEVERQNAYFARDLYEKRTRKDQRTDPQRRVKENCK